MHQQAHWWVLSGGTCSIMCCMHSQFMWLVWDLASMHCYAAASFMTTPVSFVNKL
jgi:hypothetical protein